MSLNNNILRMIRISEIRKETDSFKTLLFNESLVSQPGQFIMLSIPGVDEKPFSISYQDSNTFGITISAIGPFSNTLHTKKKGDLLGVKGPFGNPFNIEGNKILLIAGGYGIAPLRFLAEKAIKHNKYVSMLYGAKSSSDLAFSKELEKICNNISYSTIDGSKGFKGYITELMENELKNNNYDCIYSCGPELMLKKVFEIAEKKSIPCQISLERYMKCGFGVCGQCTVDPTGWRTCKEGPVFSSEKLRMIKEFGEYKRKSSGRKIRFEA